MPYFELEEKNYGSATNDNDYYENNPLIYGNNFESYEVTPWVPLKDSENDMTFLSDPSKPEENPIVDSGSNMVLVTPTVESPGTELAIGSWILILAITLMGIFAIFVCVGYTQYYSYIKKNKNSKLVNDIESFTPTLRGGDHKENHNLCSNLQNFIVKSTSINDNSTPYFGAIYKSFNSNDELKSFKFSQNSNLSQPQIPVTNHFVNHNQFHLLTPSIKLKDFDYHEINSEKKEALCKDETNTSISNGISVNDTNFEGLNDIQVDFKTFDQRKLESLRPSFKKNTKLMSDHSEKPILVSTECCKNNKRSKKNSKKLTYSKSELIELEPTNFYQTFKYYYNDGDLLVTDLVFPNICLNIEHDISKIETFLNDIRATLMNTKIDLATKTIDLISFISISHGLKSYSNPIVFTFPYGLLVETIIQFNLVSNISNNLPLVLQSAFVEVIIMYCINCWKFDKIENKTIPKSFRLWNEQPYIPSKHKLYTYIVAMLLQGSRANILSEVLTFFSLKPSPHLLQNILSEALTSKSNTQLSELFKHLKQQLDGEHFNCCSNTEKAMQWKPTAGENLNIHFNNHKQPKNSISKLTFPCFNPFLSEINITNVQKYNQKGPKLNITRARSIDQCDKNISDTKNGCFYEKENFENEGTNRVQTPEKGSNNVYFNSAIKLSFSPSNNLPGSLLPSPVHLAQSEE